MRRSWPPTAGSRADRAPLVPRVGQSSQAGWRRQRFPRIVRKNSRCSGLCRIRPSAADAAAGPGPRCHPGAVPSSRSAPGSAPITGDAAKVKGAKQAPGGLPASCESDPVCARACGGVQWRAGRSQNTPGPAAFSFAPPTYVNFADTPYKAALAGIYSDGRGDDLCGVTRSSGKAGDCSDRDAARRRRHGEDCSDHDTTHRGWRENGRCGDHDLARRGYLVDGGCGAEECTDPCGPSPSSLSRPVHQARDERLHACRDCDGGGICYQDPCAHRTVYSF